MPLARSLLLFAGIALLTVKSLPSQADERAPVPGAEGQAKSEALVKDLFKAELARTKLADRAALAATLMQQAEEAKNDPPAYYVLLKMSRDLAAKSGDVTIALKAATALWEHFDTAAIDAYAGVPEGLAATVTVPATAAKAADALMDAADAVRNRDDVVSATFLARGAEVLSRKAQSVTLASAAQRKVRELEALKAEAEKVGVHLETLKTKPDDPAANLAVARFHCFLNGRWEEGLPLLAKGGDAKLKDAAEKDLAASKGSDADKLAAADSWYDQAAGVDAGAKGAVQARAHYWYSAAAGGLTGLQKTKADKRIAELQAAADARGDKMKLWNTIRKAIGEGKTKKADIVGGAFARTEFEEVPKDGAILIGFHYTTAENGSFPGVIQPIFLTAKGEVKGKIYGAGAIRNSSAPMVTKAKPGYAVGAIYTRGGGGIDAFKVIYMKITDKGLNPNDKYEGPHIGGMGGGEGTLGGDGSFIIGIHGKVNDKGKIEAISPVSLTGEAPPKKKN